MKWFFLCGALMLGLITSAQGESWRGIIPLHSNRAQVERLLGKATLVGGVPTYYLNDEKVEVFYAKHKCGDSLNLGKWNVPFDTVLSIHVIPKRQLRLDELRLDLSKFRRERGAFDLPGNSILISDEDGLTLSLADNFVDWYSYGPGKKDRSLHCPGYSEEDERRSETCIPLALRIECSSEEIKTGKRVECILKTDAPSNAPIAVNWIVSPGASKASHSGQGVMVVLTNSAKHRIRVTAEVTSPRVCFNTASTELRVIKSKKRVRSKPREQR